jgi:hypothetical protein
MEFNVTNIIAIGSALVALGSVGVNLWLARHKPERDKADTASLITKAAGELVEDIRKQVAGLKARIVLLEATVKVQTEEIARLRAQVQVLDVENQKLQRENLKLREGL